MTARRSAKIVVPLIIALFVASCSSGGDKNSTATDSESPSRPGGSSPGSPTASRTPTPSPTLRTPRPAAASTPKKPSIVKPPVKPKPTKRPRINAKIVNWVYQLQGYQNDRLDALASAPHQLVVIDLARDAKSDFFTRQEVQKLRSSGKKVLAYFEIGSIEDFRPEYPKMQREAPGLILNRWEDWPEEHFVKYWDKWWWDNVIRTRLDQASKAGFDGVYLDTPLAYEEIDLSEVPGETRTSLGRKMTALIVQISGYAKSHRSDFWIFPQNSPELREHKGYTEAIDGIGMEELFFLATDEQCTESYCRENLENTRALRDAGKLVLAVDYVGRNANVDSVCGTYRKEKFAGYATDLELDRIRPPCP